MKTTTTTTGASEEDRGRVQGIGDNNRGGSVLTTGPVDWQQQQSVDFPCYCVANSNTVSSMSCLCLVAVSFWYCFHHIPFFRSMQKILPKLQSCGKYFCIKCALTLCMYPLRKGELKKLPVLIINKDVRKYSARKKGNYILIWSWNDSPRR